MARQQPQYTPFFSQGMGAITGAMDERRDEEAADYTNRLAADAWMGDPQAMEDLAADNPELALKVQRQSEARKQTETQRGMEKDKTFTEDLDTAMGQIGAFETFEEAQAYGQRMTDMLLEKYPERIRQQGFPEEFTPEAFNEIRTITGGQTGKPVGVPFRAVLPDGTAVMGQQNQLQNGRTITTYLKDDQGNLIRPAEYDTGLKGELAYAGAEGTKQAAIDLADEEALAALSADAKTRIMPARKSAQESLGMITALRNHPGRTSVTGVGWLNPSKFVPGTDAHNFQVLADQAAGKVFEQAYATLKGGGPITEIESRMAGQAIARMDTSQSQDEYLAALADFETAIRNGYEVLLKQAEGTFDTATPLPERAGGASQYTRSNPAAPTSKAERDALPAGAFYSVPGTDEVRVKK